MEKSSNDESSVILYKLKITLRDISDSSSHDWKLSNDFKRRQDNEFDHSVVVNYSNYKQSVHYNVSGCKKRLRNALQDAVNYVTGETANELKRRIFNIRFASEDISQVSISDCKMTRGLARQQLNETLAKLTDHEIPSYVFMENNKRIDAVFAAVLQRVIAIVVKLKEELNKIRDGRINDEVEKQPIIVNNNNDDPREIARRENFIRQIYKSIKSNKAMSSTNLNSESSLTKCYRRTCDVQLLLEFVQQNLIFLKMEFTARPLMGSSEHTRYVSRLLQIEVLLEELNDDVKSLKTTMTKIRRECSDNCLRIIESLDRTMVELKPVFYDLQRDVRESSSSGSVVNQQQESMGISRVEAFCEKLQQDCQLLKEAIGEGVDLDACESQVSKVNSCKSLYPDLSMTVFTRQQKMRSKDATCDDKRQMYELQVEIAELRTDLSRKDTRLDQMKKFIYELIAVLEVDLVSRDKRQLLFEEKRRRRRLIVADKESNATTDDTSESSSSTLRLDCDERVRLWNVNEQLKEREEKYEKLSLELAIARSTINRLKSGEGGVVKGKQVNYKLREEKRNLQDKLKMEQKRIKELEVDNARLRIEKENFVNSSDKLKEEVASLETELIATKTEEEAYDQELSKLKLANGTLECDLAKLRVDLHKCKLQLTALNASPATPKYDKYVEKLLNENLTLRMECNKLARELAEAAKTSAENKKRVQRFEGELTSVHLINVNIQSDMNQLVEKNDSIRASLDKLQAENATLRQLINNNEQLENQVTSANLATTKSVEKLPIEEPVELINLREENSRMKEQLTRATFELDSLRRVSSLSARRTYPQVQVVCQDDASQGSAAAAMGDNDNESTTEVSNSNNNNNNDYQSLKSMFQAKMLENDKLTGQVEMYKTNLDKMEADCAKLKEELAASRSKKLLNVSQSNDLMREMVNEKDALKVELAKTRIERYDTKKQLDSLMDQVGDLERERFALKEELYKLRCQKLCGIHYEQPHHQQLNVTAV